MQLLNVSSVSSWSQLDLKPQDEGTTIAAVFLGCLLLLVLGSTAATWAASRSAVASVDDSGTSAGGSSRGTATPAVPEGGLSPSPREVFLATATPSSGRSAQGRPRPLGIILQAFSLIGPSGTLTKLVETQPYKPTDCLNGLRVMSMVWIILGHTFLMPEAISGYSNPQDIAMSSLNKNSAERSVWFLIIPSSQLGVDSFFFLSGFLLSLLSLKELRARNGKFNALAAVMLRYLRLTPSLAVVMLVYAKIWPYLGSGPFASRFQDSILSRCGRTWWTELTYAMNFIPFDSNKVCMGWTWYLGDDMVFFILGIAILPVYYRRKWAGWLCVAILASASLSVTGWLIFKYDLSVYTLDDHYLRYSYWAYSKPQNRAPAYLVGVVAAWILDDWEQRGITRESCLRRPADGMRRFGAACLALLMAGVLLFLIFIPFTDFGDDKNDWNDFVSILYLDFGRILWAVCWATITILCYYGYLPFVDGFLSKPFWTPLARLTYGAYLLHPLVIKLGAGTALQYYTFSGLELAYRHLSNAVFAYSGAVLLWVLVERPVMTLTAATLKRRRGSPPEATSTTGEKDGELQFATRDACAVNTPHCNAAPSSPA